MSTTVDNFNKGFDSSTTSSTTGTTTIIKSEKYCKYKMPCGYCELLKKYCTELQYINLGTTAWNGCASS